MAQHGMARLAPGQGLGPGHVPFLPLEATCCSQAGHRIPLLPLPLLPSTRSPPKKRSLHPPPKEPKTLG